MIAFFRVNFKFAADFARTFRQFSQNRAAFFDFLAIFDEIFEKNPKFSEFFQKIQKNLKKMLKFFCRPAENKKRRVMETKASYEADFRLFSIKMRGCSLVMRKRIFIFWAKRILPYVGAKPFAKTLHISKEEIPWLSTTTCRQCLPIVSSESRA